MAELADTVTRLNHDGPTAPRSRGSGLGTPLMEEGWESLPIGRGELLREGDDLLIVAGGPWFILLWPPPA